MSRRKLAVLFDAVEERWTSMEHVGEMLLSHFRAEHSDRFETFEIRPRFFLGFSSFPGATERTRLNANRFVTRFGSYPARLLLERRKYDLFHIVDHSYAQLAHVLPSEGTGVYCHDLDAFACLLTDARRTPLWRKAMARTLLRGLERAALVFYSTEQIRSRILKHGLLEDRKLVHAPYGVSPEFSLEIPGADLPVSLQINRPYLLHVGSSVPRKRLDVLFKVFAAARREIPDLLLVQRGASLLPEHRSAIAALGIGDAVVQPATLTRAELASLYRRAELVLLTSEREGFGLPVIEALASGACVVASDIEAFREVGADAVVYCPVADVEAWARVVVELIRTPDSRPASAARLARAAQYTWAACTDRIANAYERLVTANSSPAAQIGASA